MRIKTSFIFSLLLAAVFCCNRLVAQQVQKIYINPKNPAVQKQSNFVDSIRLIPFQMVDGLNSDDANVIQTGSYYMITDYGSGVLYFYSTTGAFIRKLNYKSVVGKMYPVYYAPTNQIVFFGDNDHYTLTSKDKLKILLDWSNKRNLKYFKKYVINLNDTDFVIRKSRPDKFDLTRAIPMPDHRYIQTKISTSPLYTDSMGYEVSIYADGTLLKNYFPYNRINEPAFLFSEESASLSFSGTPNVSYITRPYRDTIYRLVKDSIYPVYQIVLPLENTLPAAFFSKRFKTKTDKDNFTRNSGWVFHSMFNFYETPRLVFISMNFFSRLEAFVYDKKTQVAYNTSKIKPDEAEYNLALLSLFLQPSGNRLFKLISADQLISFFKQHPNKQVPSDIAAFLKTNPAKKTPVVVEYKLKDE